MIAPKYILAIDQGTTGTRTNIFNHAGALVASAYQEFPQYFPKPGWVEHDAMEIWQSVEATIQKAITKIDPAHIAAIGITNQRETTVMWDKKTGKPVHRAIVWQCRRTAEMCDELKRKKFSNLFHKKTGLVLDAYFSGTKIKWLLDHVPGLRKKAQAGQVLFGTIDTWIIYKLTGGLVHATDYSNASRTLVFNIIKKQWDSQLLKILKIPAQILPQVQNSAGEFGRTIKIKNLPAGIPITGVAGDQQAALFGQACFEEGTAKNTYGTGCFMLLHTGPKPVFSKNGLLTTLCCDAWGKPAYALEGAVFIGGAVIQWLRDGLQVIDSASQTQKICESISSTGGVYFIPGFVGLGAPYWNPAARGAIVGLTRGSGRAHIIRAAVESMAFQSYELLELMQKEAHLKASELKVDGGACANNFLMQFQANLNQQKVLRPKIIETTSLGAAYLAGLGVGFWKNPSELKKHWQLDQQFSSKISGTQRSQQIGEWKAAVKRVL